MEAEPYRQLIDLEERSLNWPEKNTFQKAQLDFKATGTTLETHPVKVLREHYWAYDVDSKKICKANELVRVATNRQVFVYGMTLVKQAPPSAKGMVFLTLEDETGMLNLAFSPQVYAKYYKLVEGRGFLCLSGQLQKAGDHHSILVKKVYSEKQAKIQRLEGHTSEPSTQENRLSLRPRGYY